MYIFSERKDNVAVHRQKTFFDRYRNKNRRGTLPANTYRQRMSVPNVYRYSRSDVVQPQVKQKPSWNTYNGNQRKMKDHSQHAKTDNNELEDFPKTFLDVAKNGDDMELKELSTISSRDESSPISSRGSKKERFSFPLRHDSACQTGDDLLIQFYPHLRRRAKSKMSADRTRNRSLSPRASGKRHPDAPLKTTIYRLPENHDSKGKTKYLSVKGRACAHAEPVMDGSCMRLSHDHSPLLPRSSSNSVTEMTFSDCDSQSDEQEYEYFDDLHELVTSMDEQSHISGISIIDGELRGPRCPNSLLNSSSSAASNFATSRTSYPEAAAVYDTSQSSYPRAIATSNGPVVYRDSEESTAAVVVVQPTKDIYPRPQASPTEQPEEEDLSALQPFPGRSRRISAFSQSSCSDEASSIKSLENLSVHGLKLLDDEEMSVSDFHQYMKAKGLELDLSSVQTSDV